MILACSFCDRHLDDLEAGTALAARVAAAALGGAVGDQQVNGWHIYLTGSEEPTVICDRCSIIIHHAATAIAAALDNVTNIRTRRPA